MGVKVDIIDVPPRPVGGTGPQPRALIGSSVSGSPMRHHLRSANIRLIALPTRRSGLPARSAVAVTRSSSSHPGRATPRDSDHESCRRRIHPMQRSRLRRRLSFRRPSAASIASPHGDDLLHPSNRLDRARRHHLLLWLVPQDPGPQLPYAPPSCDAEMAVTHRRDDASETVRQTMRRPSGRCHHDRIDRSARQSASICCLIFPAIQEGR